MTKDELVVKTMHLAYLVQVKTEYAVFIRYSGHIDSLDIQIVESKKKWQTNVLESQTYMAYKHSREDYDPLIATLLAKIEVLEQILRDGAVDYDVLDYEEIVTREYTF